MSDNAKRYVEQGMKGFGIKGNDAWALASYFKLSTGDIIRYKAQPVKESPKLVRYQLYPPLPLVSWLRHSFEFMQGHVRLLANGLPDSKPED